MNKIESEQWYKNQKFAESYKIDRLIAKIKKKKDITLTKPEMEVILYELERMKEKAREDLLRRGYIEFASKHDASYREYDSYGSYWEHYFRSCDDDECLCQKNYDQAEQIWRMYR